MSTIDEITKEKQRISEALARVEVQREKLTSQLGELEAAERVLARYNKDMGPKKMASAKTSPAVTKPATSALGRRQARTAGAKPPGGKRSSPSLSDQVLALATGKTQQEITAACKSARPNHVGAAIARHKRAGRIEERDGKLYGAQSGRTEQHPAVIYKDKGAWLHLRVYALPSLHRLAGGLRYGSLTSICVRRVHWLRLTLCSNAVSVGRIVNRSARLAESNEHSHA